MEKNKKDYLHLYLGCECYLLNYATDDNGKPKKYKSKIYGIDRGSKLVIADGWYGHAYENVQLILRPLRAILNTEAFEVYKIYFGKGYVLDYTGDTGSANFIPKQRRILAKDAIRIFDGLDYVTGDFMTVIKVSNYLRSIFIDVDGLIEAGLAIDKTTLK